MSLSINKEKIKTYAVSILVPLVLGAIVGVLTTRTMHYENLNKPFLAPPAILFPIAWSILYTLMGILEPPVHPRYRSDLLRPARRQPDLADPLLFA